MIIGMAEYKKALRAKESETPLALYSLESKLCYQGKKDSPSIASL